ALRVEICGEDGFQPDRELTDAIFAEGMKGELIARGKRMGLVLDVGGYYIRSSQTVPSDGDFRGAVVDRAVVGDCQSPGFVAGEVSVRWRREHLGARAARGRADVGSSALSELRADRIVRGARRRVPCPARLPPQRSAFLFRDSCRRRGRLW